MIPYGSHYVDNDDIEAVVNVLKNENLTQGKQVPQFENALCEYTGANYAVAVNSGTSALHVACLAAGLGQGDIGWTVPNSFVASANCIMYCGAKVDFVDINASTRNICLDALEAKLLQAQRLNQLPKVLVVVHFSGASCDMAAIRELTSPFGIILIEDCAHALGAQYLDGNVGCCRYSDMAVLSFHPVKSATTAEGGAVLTNDPDYFASIQLYAKHGITRDEKLMVGSSFPECYYQQITLGFNYRLSDLHAALGISQLKKLDQFISKRRQLAREYNEQLAELPLTLPSSENLECSSWHIYVVELLQHDRDDIIRKLHQAGIGVNVHYIPIHLHPFYQQLGFKLGDFPNTERYYHRAITLPLFPHLSATNQKFVIDTMKELTV